MNGGQRQLIAALGKCAACVQQSSVKSMAREIYNCMHLSLSMQDINYYDLHLFGGGCFPPSPPTG